MRTEKIWKEIRGEEGVEEVGDEVVLGQTAVICPKTNRVSLHLGTSRMAFDRLRTRCQSLPQSQFGDRQ